MNPRLIKKINKAMDKYYILFNTMYDDILLQTKNIELISFKSWEFFISIEVKNYKTSYKSDDKNKIMVALDSLRIKLRRSYVIQVKRVINMVKFFTNTRKIEMINTEFKDNTQITKEDEYNLNSYISLLQDAFKNAVSELGNFSVVLGAFKGCLTAKEFEYYTLNFKKIKNKDNINEGDINKITELMKKKYLNQLDLVIEYEKNKLSNNRIVKLRKKNGRKQ